MPRSLSGHAKALRAWAQLKSSPLTLEQLQKEHARTRKAAAAQRKRHPSPAKQWVPIVPPLSSSLSSSAAASTATDDSTRTVDTATGAGAGAGVSAQAVSTTTIQPTFMVAAPRAATSPTSNSNSNSWQGPPATVASARMAWGSAQEANSLLNVMNAVVADAASSSSSSSLSSSSTRTRPLEAVTFQEVIVCVHRRQSNIYMTKPFDSSSFEPSACVGLSFFFHSLVFCSGWPSHARMRWVDCEITASSVSCLEQ